MIPESTKVIYITREIERALGMTPSEDYIIISNKTKYGEEVERQYPEYVTLIDSNSKDMLGTTDLLLHKQSIDLISRLKSSKPEIKPTVLVFKNTLRVEQAARTLNCKLLNPPALLSEKVENKISQIRWLGQAGLKYLPPHAAKVTKNITWKSDNPFIIQWNHGHTGDGTILIKTIDDLKAVQEKFPERIARVSAFIKGPSFTVNVVVTANRILIGNISYQITGMQPFTDSTFSTVGNDWSLARKLLNQDDKKAIESIAEEIGVKLQSEGWRGLFGIDVIKEEDHGRIYLIEVNARQPASTTFESLLQDKQRAKGARGLTTFEAHVRALNGLPIDQDLISLDDGAQIVQRVTKNIQDVFDDISTTLRKVGHTVVAYQNTEYNSDLLRVQSDTGIMEEHGAFNVKGREIAEAVKSAHLKIEV